MDGGGRKLLSLRRVGEVISGGRYSAAARKLAAADHRPGEGDRLVLPRRLRFAARHLARITASSKPLSAGIGSVLAVGFLSLSIGYGVQLGGYANGVVSSAASAAGLGVGAIKISGQVETNEADVLVALDLRNHSALLGLDLRAARKRLGELDWVEEATVRKFYPGTLEISLVEKKPFAVWQRDEKLSVIESNGDVITRLADRRQLRLRHALLPRIVGEGAEKLAPELFALVSVFPSLSSRVESYIRVANRRWNILLRNDIVIQLPEAAEREALSAVVKMDREQQLLSRAIEVVDMRLANRVVLRMTPEAAEKRRVLVEQRSKRMRKAEKSI